MKQSQVLDILKTGASVFLTGEPGSGKTHVINEYKEYLQNNGIQPATTASTGIAATHVGGVTIHSWSGIGIKRELNRIDLKRISRNQNVILNILYTKVLIIDEVSMLTSEVLDMVDMVCREIKQNQDPFGGMQIIFSGDFFQLPPVLKENVEVNGQITYIDKSISHFAYDSDVWLRVKPTVCYLTEQYRQDDIDFISILSAIRHNNFNNKHLTQIETRKVENLQYPENVPMLYSLNVDVDDINNKKLDTIQNKIHPFFMSSEGLDYLVKQLKKNCLSPETLCLKVGAIVMFTKNNTTNGYVNGTIGTVELFNKDDGYPIIKTKDGRYIKAEPMDWSVEVNNNVIAKVTQIPLRLAWAITVHKSQGMNLDEAVVDLSKVFEFGQGYVALSRVRRLSGLYILGWNKRTFQVHPQIMVKDEMFINDSKNTETIYLKMSTFEIEEKCAKFRIYCNAKKQNTTNSNKAYKLTVIREKYPNAYMPWDKIQDQQLRELFEKGISTHNISIIFKRNSGAIRSRLKKLGILDN